MFQKKFTEEEIIFIKNNISKMTPKELAIKLNRSEGSISSLIFRKNIKIEITPFPNEKFKKIFNERYTISSKGRLFDKIGREMKPYNASGYLRFNLAVSKNVRKKVFLHILVAENFLTKELGKNFVNHKDFDKTNNDIENLEWMSQSENELHKFKNNPKLKEHLSNIVSKKSNLDKENTIKSVEKICEMLCENKSCAEIGRIMNVTSKRVSAIKNKRLWKNISDRYF